METSYGNSGVVERDGFVPITFPSSLRALLRFASNRTTAAHYHLGALPSVLPWLIALKRYSQPAALDRYAAASYALCAHAIEEHRALASEAGAEHLFRETGWLRLYRSEASYHATAEPLIARAEAAGVPFRSLDPVETITLEPHLAGGFHRSLFFPETQSVSSPGDVVKAYFKHYAFGGGRTATTEVKRLRPIADGWEVATSGRSYTTDHVVIALGPWSMDVLRPLGYRFPFVVKRGYHRHYRAEGNAALSRPVVDMDEGFLLTPMKDGIRLTTGIEFARRDARPTPVQLKRAYARARELFPLAGPVELAPWKGARPCFPDSLPMVGRAPRHDRLWLNFGHGHLGFTQGPITGRLLAELMMGERPLVDVKPYRPERFSRR
jgi:D-amino-acid dehydrogenase